MIKIAIDFDGVVADTLILKKNWLKEKGIEIEDSSLLTKTYFLDKFDPIFYEQMQVEIGLEDTLSCKPIQGSMQSMFELSNDFEILVITARNEEKLKWARLWLDRWAKDIAVSNIISSYKCSKLEIAQKEACVALVDNDPRHLALDENGSVLRILFCPSENLTCMDPAILIASNWNVLMQQLLGIDR